MTEADFDTIFAQVSKKALSIQECHALLLRLLPAASRLSAAEREICENVGVDWFSIQKQSAYVARRCRGDAKRLLDALDSYSLRQHALLISITKHEALITSGASDKFGIDASALFVRGKQKQAAEPFQEFV